MTAPKPGTSPPQHLKTQFYSIFKPESVQTNFICVISHFMFLFCLLISFDYFRGATL